MKIPLKLSLISLILLGGVFFIFPSISYADTYYQQLTDSSGSVSLSSVSEIAVGSFYVGQTYRISDGSRGFAVWNNNNNSGCTVQIGIASTSALGQGVSIYSAIGIPGSFSDQFIDLFSVNGPSTLVAGNTYFLSAFTSGCASPSGDVLRMNLSDTFFYGYLTSETGESIPIFPGISGFTDVGIATTSQQEYCYTNFSTSTGLLDSVGQSISLGFCNVAVFLFIPNTQTLNQFSALATTTKSRIPFSYYYDLQSLFSTGSSSGSNFIDIEFDISSTSVCSTSFGCIVPSVVAFSTTTISAYIDDSTRTTLRLLMSAVIWLAFAYYAYGVITKTMSKH